MITPIEFCQKHISLTKPQIMMITHHIKSNTFVGIGRCRYQSIKLPVVYHCKKYECIDGAGYYQEFGGDFIEYRREEGVNE